MIIIEQSSELAGRGQAIMEEKVDNQAVKIVPTKSIKTDLDT